MAQTPQQFPNDTNGLKKGQRTDSSLSRSHRSVKNDDGGKTYRWGGGVPSGGQAGRRGGGQRQKHSLTYLAVCVIPTIWGKLVPVRLNTENKYRDDLIWWYRWWIMEPRGQRDSNAASHLSPFTSICTKTPDFPRKTFIKKLNGRRYRAEENGDLSVLLWR